MPAFSLLSGIRRDPFALFFTTLRDLCRSRIPFACFRPILWAESGEQKSAKPHKSCQALQNEHLQKSSHNSREMNTYEIIGLKVEQNEHLQKKRGALDLGSDPFAIATDRAMINVP
jgi:hypothetical protein